MESVIVMDMGFRQLGELSLYESLRMKRSFFGVGGFTLTLGADDPGAAWAEPGALLFLASQPENLMLLEDVTRTRERVTLNGVQLKGLARRRVCVPPLTMPASLWRYQGGAWTELTDEGDIRVAMAGDVYQGLVRPENPMEGMVWLDMSELGASYVWGVGLSAGDVVNDPGAARLRSQYQNFGWDRFVGSAEDAYLHYAVNNLIAPEDAKRAVPGLVAAGSRGRGAALPWQARFDKLTEIFEQIGEASGLGWDILPDYQNKRFVFTVLEGRDFGATGARTVIISEEMGNAAGVTRKRKTSAQTSTVYAGGAGEDENRLILSVGGEAEGLARREAWAEAGSVEDADMLTLFGQSKRVSATDTLEAEVLDGGACRYGVDFALGDVVAVAGAGAQMNARIVEVTETYESGARSVNCAFGDAPVTTGGVLARLTRAAAR